VKLAIESGYDPNGLPILLEKISEEIKLETGKEEQSTWLDSHPYTPKRVDDMDKLIAKATYTVKPATSEEHADFIKNFEGICIGENPRNGVFQDSKFIHPDLGFSFIYPKDWETINTPTSVGFISEDQQAQLVFSIADTLKDPAVYSEDLIKELYKYYAISPTRNESLDINGFPAQVVQFEQVKGEITIEATFLWLARDDKLYEFVQISDKKHKSIVEKTAKSLHPISTEERNSIFQTVLKVVEVNDGETLEELSIRTHNVLELEFLALINNLVPSDNKLESQWIKIGVKVKY
jgi:predicted Zn-dependent protease